MNLIDHKSNDHQNEVFPLPRLNDLKNISSQSASIKSVSEQELKNYHKLYPKEQLRLRNWIFTQYLNEKSLKSEDIPVKVSNTGYVLDREQICEEIKDYFGIEIGIFQFMRGRFCEKLKELITAQLERDGKNEPTREEKLSAKNTAQGKYRKFAEILQKWLKNLGKTGSKLKLSQNRKNIDYVWISNETDIPYSYLVTPNSRLSNLLKKAVKEIGIKNVQSPEKFIGCQYTYRELLDYGTHCRGVEVEGNNNAQQQVNNTRSALLQFLKEMGFSLDSTIGSELGLLFSESRQSFALTIANIHTKKKLFSELGKWQSYYRTLLLIDDLPADFADALALLIETSDTTCQKLTKLLDPANANNSKIARWARGVSTPTLAQLPYVLKIEEFFNLPPQTLAKRVVFNPISGVNNALSRGNFPRPIGVKYSVLAKYLPINFPSLPVDEQWRLVTCVNDYLNQNKSKYRRELAVLSKIRYGLKASDFQYELLSEMDKLIDFKTQELTPSGYQRKEGSQWRNSPGRKGTVDIFKSMASSVFGVLTAPEEKLGAGVEIRQLSLTHLVLPAVWRLYIAFMKNRTGRIPLGNLKRYLSMTYSWLDLEYGWVAQSPWLAERLEQIPGILTEADVALAKSDWREFIRKIEIELNDLKRQINHLEKNAPPHRDSHIPIKPILESEKPLEILSNAINRYERRIPRHPTAPIASAISLRNIILLRILAETALRTHNLLNLDWKPDNTGQLRRDRNGCYKIEIPWTEFKNPDSSFFGSPKAKQNYVVKLSNRLTPLLDEYLFSVRNFLLERWASSKKRCDTVRDEGFLFVASPQSAGQRTSYDTAKDILVNFSSLELVYNPLTGAGIEGVESFCMHAVRHIMATHMLKLTGSYEIAADAIQDTVETVKAHYGRYSPKDRDKKFRSLITDLMEHDEE